MSRVVYQNLQYGLQPFNVPLSNGQPVDVILPLPTSGPGRMCAELNGEILGCLDPPGLQTPPNAWKFVVKGTKVPFTGNFGVLITIGNTSITLLTQGANIAPRLLVPSSITNAKELNIQTNSLQVEFYLGQVLITFLGSIVVNVSLVKHSSGGVQFIIGVVGKYRTANGVLLTASGVKQARNLLLLTKTTDQSILLDIKTSFESIYGQNLCRSVLRTPTSVYMRRPPIVRVVKGVGCTLTEKLNSIRSPDLDTNYLIAYALLRYFLWYLIRNCWTVDILKQSNTKRFFDALASSKYAPWIEAFEAPVVLGYDKYFL